MKHYFKNCSNNGKLVLLIGLLLSMPLAVLTFFPEECEYAIAFIIPSLISIILGVLICRFSKQDINANDWH